MDVPQSSHGSSTVVHTFKFAKSVRTVDGSQPFNAVHTVMNEAGMVLVQSIVTSKEHEEIVPDLEGLAHRLRILKVQVSWQAVIECDAMIPVFASIFSCCYVFPEFLVYIMKAWQEG